MKDFTKSDFAKVENFICSNAKITFTLETLHDEFVLGPTGMYTIKTEFDGVCKMQPWNIENIRVNYWMAAGPLKEKFRGQKYHISYNFATGTADGKKVLIKDEIEDLKFNNSIAFSAYFETQFTKAFEG